jgi:hypothetical protein
MPVVVSAMIERKLEGPARCAVNGKHCPKGQYSRDFAITTNTAVNPLPG